MTNEQWTRINPTKTEPVEPPKITEIPAFKALAKTFDQLGEPVEITVLSKVQWKVQWIEHLSVDVHFNTIVESNRIPEDVLRIQHRQQAKVDNFVKDLKKFCKKIKSKKKRFGTVYCMENNYV